MSEETLTDIPPLLTANREVCPAPLRVDWGRTMAIRSRLADDPDYLPPDADAPYGRYGGRPIIGSGMTKIIGGVYLGMKPREAVVVAEYAGQPGNLSDLYSEFIQAMDSYVAANGGRFKSLVLGSVFELVKNRLRYARDAELDALVKKITDHGGGDQKIALHAFLNEGTGACTHQSLLVGYLLEKLQGEADPEKKLEGYFSIERNSVSIENLQIGAHCWVRYTTAKGKVIIMDVAQKRFGELEELKKDPKAWFYDRPESIPVI